MKKMLYTNEPFAVSGPTEADEDLARLCKALGHPARVAILRRLIQADRCFCGEIVDGLPLSQATVSQHLKVLKEAGLIDGEVEGPRTCYCVERQALAWLFAALAECCGQMDGKGQADGEVQPGGPCCSGHGLDSGAGES